MDITKIKDEKLNKYIDLLANRRDAFYAYKKNGPGWRMEKEQLTAEHVRAHLSGTTTLSFPAISTDGACKWLGFDFDDISLNPYMLKNMLVKNGYSVLHDSKREDRDGHLLLLFDRPVKAVYVRRVAREFLAHAGVTVGGALEVFPKQDDVKEGSIGNGLRMPLGINQKPAAKGARGWFEGVEKDIEVQLDYLLSAPLNSGDRIEAIGKALLEADRKKREARFDLSRFIVCKRDREEKTCLLDVIPNHLLKRAPKGYYTRCPQCEIEGFDRSGTNLWISEDGFGFKCFRNNGEHTTLDVLRALGC